MSGSVKKHPVLSQLSTTGAPSDQALIAQTIPWDVNRRELVGDGQRLMAPHGDVYTRDVVKGQLIFKVIPEHEDNGSTVVPHYISCFNGVVDRHPEEDISVLQKQFKFIGTARRNLTVSDHNIQTEPELAVQVGGHTVIWNNSTDVTLHPGDIVVWGLPERTENFDSTLQVAQSLPTIDKLSPYHMDKIIGSCVYELVNRTDSLPLQFIVPDNSKNFDIQSDIELALTVKQFVCAAGVKVSILLQALGIQTLNVPGDLARDVTDTEIQEYFSEYLQKSVNLDNLTKTDVRYDRLTEKLVVGGVGTDMTKQKKLQRAANFMGKLFELGDMFAPDATGAPLSLAPDLAAMLFSRYHAGKLGDGRTNASMSKMLGIATNVNNGTTDVTTSVVKACDSANDIFNVAYDFYRNIASTILGKATTTSLPGTEVGIILQ